MMIIQRISIPSEYYTKNATLYQQTSIQSKAAILYFHGGGLLYGNREDLPESHIQAFCSNGYPVIAMDYPLAPAVRLPAIRADVHRSICWYLENRMHVFQNPLPYILFGRSAGAYLCLLASMEQFQEPPAGLLSYYGYGIFCSAWYCTPSPFYMRYPLVSERCLQSLSQVPQASAALETHFAVYVYLRQRGRWADLLMAPGETDLALCHSLRTSHKETAPCPLFFAHALQDPDIPFSEFCALTQNFPACEQFIAHEHVHDFDRDASSSATTELLASSVQFLNRCLSTPPRQLF